MPDVEVHPLLIDEIESLVKLDRSIQTTRVWQLDHSVKDIEFQVTFREMRLPRPASILYPYPAEDLYERIKAYDGILVAKMDQDLAGYVSIRKDRRFNSAWVDELVVDLLVRRKSIATALLLAVQDWSAQMGLRRITIEMQSKNYPAICLVSKLGYEFSGYNDQYYPSQEIALFFSKFVR